MEGPVDSTLFGIVKVGGEDAETVGVRTEVGEDRADGVAELVVVA